MAFKGFEFRFALWKIVCVCARERISVISKRIDFHLYSFVHTQCVSILTHIIIAIIHLNDEKEKNMEYLYMARATRTTKATHKHTNRRYFA